MPVEPLAAKDLDSLVARVLRELPPDPPLRLGEVRDLLDLDRQYFSSTDTSYLSRTLSKLRRAGQQVVMRPTLLLEAVRTAKLSALWLPDRKRILINTEIPDLKKRWAEAHEIGHSLPDWHRDFFLGDDSHSLSPQCHETLENEANYVAGQLLFLQDRFIAEARDLAPTIGSIKVLAKKFRNTHTTTLWRFAEQAHPDKPMVAIVCGHPQRPPDDFDPGAPCKYVIESDSFRERFSGTVSEIDIYNILQSYCSMSRGGPLGSADTVLRDVNGEGHLFHFETFFNRYEALTLGVYLRPRRAQVVVGCPLMSGERPLLGIIR